MKQYFHPAHHHLLKRNRRWTPSLSTISTILQFALIYNYNESAPVASAFVIQQPTHQSFSSSINHHRQRRNSISSMPSPSVRRTSSLLRQAATTNNEDDIPQNSSQTKRQRLVLIGGGHAHAQVIKSLHADYRSTRDPNLHVTLIDRQASASYSGMVPGCIADLYTPEETMLELEPLAKWAKFDAFHQATVVDVDTEQKVVWIAKSDGAVITSDSTSSIDNTNLEAIPFDVLSLDIGSTSRGFKDVPGAKEYTLPTRPISNLVRQFEQWTDEILENQQQSSASPPHVVVIGAGAAGIELSMSVQGRWKSILSKRDNQPESSLSGARITLLNAGSQLVPDETDWCRSKLESLLKERNIDIIHECTVQSVTASKQVVIQKNEQTQEIPFTHCIWATGAEAHDLAFKLGNNKNNPLDVTDHGWFRVTPTLQSTSHPFVFAAGDCCHISDASPPKAGVYAVRAGPVLSHNLVAYLNQIYEAPIENYDPAEIMSAQLQEYKPQSDFLKLLVCGDGTALGFRFGIPLYGRWVMKLKDKIDNQFMDLFRADKLPDLEKDRANYDPTKQYDATQSRPPPLAPQDAADMLMTEDVDESTIDFEVAWNVLRDMNDMPDYKQKVLDCIFSDEGLTINNPSSSTVNTN